MKSTASWMEVVEGVSGETKARRFLMLVVLGLRLFRRLGRWRRVCFENVESVLSHSVLGEKKGGEGQD